MGLDKLWCENLGTKGCRMSFQYIAFELILKWNVVQDYEASSKGISSI